MDWATLFATRASRARASEIRELLKLLDQPDIISFAGGIPDARLFPNDAFAEAYRARLSDDRAAASLQYSTSEGHRPLREWVADRMSRAGVACGIENVLVTSGSQQALDFVAKMLISPGDTVLVERPTYLGALQAFNAYEPTYDALPGEGTNRTPASLAEAAAIAGKSAVGQDAVGQDAVGPGPRVKLAYVTPDFANPTGLSMDRAARIRLLDLADALDIAVIEDTAYEALRYDGVPEPSILALDAARSGGIEAARTILTGSFSKTLSPGLRVGWICAPTALISRLVLLKQAADLHSPTINQMVVHDVAATLFETQVERCRAVYRARRDRMLAALEQHMPAGITWSRPDGGMFVWVTLPEGVDGAELLARSVREARVAFVPGRAFHADGSGGNTLRLSFSSAEETTIDTGIERLGRLLDSWESAEPRAVA